MLEHLCPLSPCLFGSLLVLFSLSPSFIKVVDINDGSGISESISVTFNGTTLADDLTFGRDLMFADLDVVTTAYMADRNLSAPEYTFYGESNSLFNSFDVASPDLKDNDAMKQFLSDHGSVTESFSGVADAVDGLYDSVDSESKSSKLVYYAAIAGLAVAVALLALLCVRKA